MQISNLSSPNRLFFCLLALLTYLQFYLPTLPAPYPKPLNPNQNDCPKNNVLNKFIPPSPFPLHILQPLQPVHTLTPLTPFVFFFFFLSSPLCHGLLFPPHRSSRQETLITILYPNPVYHTTSYRVEDLRGAMITIAIRAVGRAPIGIWTK